MLLLTFYFYFVNQIESQFREGLVKKGVGIVQTASVQIGASIYLNEKEFLNKMLKSLENDPDIAIIYVTDKKDDMQYGFQYSRNYKMIKNFIHSNANQSFFDNYFLIKQSLFYRDEYQGTVILGLSLKWAKQKSADQRRNLLIISLATAFIFILGSSFLARAIARPLNNAAQRITEYPEKDGIFNLRLPVKGKDEIAQLAQAFNHLADDLDHHIRELNESKKNLETLFQLSPVPILIADTLGKIEVVNDAACSFFRTEREILLKMNLDRFFQQDDLNAIVNRIGQEKRDIRGYVTTISLVDGQKRIGELNIASQQDETEYIKSIIIATIDITEKIQIQRELLKNQTKLQRINTELTQKTDELEQLSSRDKKNAYKLSQLIRISQKMMRATTPNSILQEIVDNVRLLLEADECLIYLWDSKTKDLIASLSYPNAVINRVQTHIKKDKSIVWKTYLDNQAAIIHADAVNSNEAKNLGLNASRNPSIISVPISEKDYRYGVLIFIQYGHSTFQEADLHLLNTLANQAAILLDNIHLLHALQEKATSLENAYSDLQKSNQQVIQLQKMESLGTLVGGIAHDFNNILGIIIPNIDLLRKDALGNNKIIRRSNIIQEAAQRAADLTRQLLMFSRNQDIEVRALSPNRFLSELSSLLKRTLGKEYDILLDLDPEVEDIQADENRLTQVLINLAVNARDAMPNGGEIVLRTRMIHYKPKSETKFPEKEYVCISVTDTGSGIRREHLDKVFDPFFTTKSVGKGTGLGLSVVYGIIQSHNGFVEIESKEGKGTTFLLYFPPQPASISIEEPPKPLTIPQGSENILVVDDENMIRESVKEILETLGYSVMTVDSGIEAIQILKKKKIKFQLAIVDMAMPKMNGVETIQNILKIDPDVKILLSSGQIDKDRNLPPELKLQGILPKPYRLRELALKVRQVLNYKAEAVVQ